MPSDPHICEAACANDPVCDAWTYVVRPPLAGSCCLKTGTVPAASANPTCTSGVKPGALTFVDTTHASLNATDGHAASLVSAPLRPRGLPLDSVRVRVFVDGSVVESFFADGRTAITRRAYPTRPGACTLALVAGAERSCTFSYVQAWELSL